MAEVYYHITDSFKKALEELKIYRCQGCQDGHWQCFDYTACQVFRGLKE